jgi:hypothetical protein
MALGFFRRRQKMVIIIMVVLMVSFLVGGYGVSTFFQTDPNKARIGPTRFGDLTRGELMSAQADIEALQAVGLGNMDRARKWSLEMAFLRVVRGSTENRAVETYALLLKEADAAGAVVSQRDVDEFFQSIGYVDESAYKSLISSLRSGRQGWTEQFIRGAVASWLKIFKAYTNVGVDCPPSETELQATWRDIREEIDLGAVRVKAEDFVKGLPDPNQEAIRRQFDKYQTVYPNEGRQPDQMAFGYKQPGRAMVQYMLLDGEAVGRVTEPSFDTLIDYFNRNKGEFFREVPIAPATRPADANAPATRPADANTPTILVPLTFAEAKAQVIERLRDATIRARMDELTTLVENNVRTLPKSSADPNTVYKEVLKGMVAPAGDVLDKQLKGLKIENVSIKDAMVRLAGESKLAAICFPWGKHGTQTLDPSVKVTLIGDMKLREALDKICVQVQWPRLEWAGCQSFNNMLFSVKVAGQGIDFFPVRAEETPLWTYEQFAKDEVLGSCFASASGEGRSLAQTVFSAAGLAENPAQTPLIKVGEQGRRMYLIAPGADNGRLLWRLAQVAPAHVPNMMTPEIHEQVVNDLKLADAMKLAEKDATNIRDGAVIVGLATAAQRKGLKLITTGLFPRQQLMNNFSVVWSVVPKLDEIDTPVLQAYFIPKAFDLMPKSAEPNAPAQRPAVALVPIAAKAEVLVIQRIDYRPLLRREYEDSGKFMVAQFLAYQRQMLIQSAWFNDRNISLRLGYRQ